MSDGLFGSVIEVLTMASLFGAIGFLAAASFARKGKRRGPLAGAGLSAAVFLAVMGANYAYLNWVRLPALARQEIEAKRRREDEAANVRTGHDAPPFQLRTLDGVEFDVGKLRGKVVLLNFFATWCGPCMQELPHLQDLWKANSGHPDFALLVIDREEPAETVRAFVKSKGFTFPVAADPKRKVYSLYAKELIPRTYLISRDGAIVYATTGFFEKDAPKLKEALAKQLNGSS